MAQGTPAPTGAVFGPEFAVTLEDDAPAPATDWSDDALDGTASAPQQPTPEPAEAAPPVEDQQQQPAQEQEQQQSPDQGTQAAADEQPVGEETPAPRRWAERYETPEALEHGYRHIQRLYSRTQQEAQQEAQRRAQVEREREQLRAALQQVTPHLDRLRHYEALVQQLPPDQRPVVPMPEQGLPSEEDINSLIQQRIEQGTTQARAEIRAEVQSENLQKAVESFVATHPDAAEGTPLDYEIGAVIEEFQTDPQGHRRFDLFPITESNLEVAYQLAKDPALRSMVIDLDLVPNAENIEIAKEAKQNPALAEVLYANPTAVDTDKGLQWARKMAGLPGMYQQAAQAVAPPSPEQARRAAHVETGGTGAPVNQAPGPVPQDEFDEAIAAYTKGRGNNVFGLQVTD